MNDPIDLVSAALVQCQGELRAAAFDSSNPFFKSRYASLGSVIEVSRPVLAKHGLAILQRPIIDGQSVTLETKIIHASGQSLDGGSLTLDIDAGNRATTAQAAGALLTYLRRYAWSTVLGIHADEDTDGEPETRSNAPRTEKRVSTPHPPQQNPVPPAQQAASATVAFRLRALNNLQAAPGQPKRGLVEHYLRHQHWISLDQECEDWPLQHVPTTAEGMAELAEEIGKFERQMRENQQTEQT